MTIEQARKIVGQKLGFPNFDGSVSAYSKLSQADQVRLTDGLAQFIVNNPTQFTADQVDLSKKRVASPLFNRPLEDTSFDYGQFLSLTAANAVPTLNAAAGLGKTLVIIAGGLAIAWAYFNRRPRR